MSVRSVHSPVHDWPVQSIAGTPSKSGTALQTAVRPQPHKGDGNMFNGSGCKSSTPQLAQVLAICPPCVTREC